MANRLSSVCVVVVVIFVYRGGGVISQWGFRILKFYAPLGPRILMF